MVELRKFNELVRDFTKDVDFLTIYIEEAHPIDGWRVSTDPKLEYKQHVTLKDRVKAASLLIDAGIESPVVLDNMENEANKAYGGFPERLYIILDGVILYQGNWGPIKYSVEEVRDWLTKYKG
ncbi:hypothetical protein SNE40_012192 [Patella caerulea]|uniref:Iodothyronine deiodinase n=1 Tax=Patella caerulea TaxID=87958 RepID=A0AAN8JN69_PATCE